MSKIEWTGRTWNPVVGCSRVSPGCEHCYAEGVAHRGMSEHHRGLTVLGKSGKGARWNGTVRQVPSALAKPIQRNKSTTWFVNSMSDLFHERLVDSDEGRRYIAAVFGVMAACPQHTFQVLTKRPGQAREWFMWVAAQRDDEVRQSGSWACTHAGASVFCCASATEVLNARGWAISNGLRRQAAWPLPNVHIGVSVEDQRRADERIPALIKIPAAKRFLSAEPLLGPLDIGRWLEDGCPDCDVTGANTCAVPGIDWVIAGGESGPGARACDVEWIRDVVDQCRGRHVPVFVKQLGAKPTADGQPLTLIDRKGGDPDEWPEDLRVREIPEEGR